jgi:hypothetical protein
MISPTNGDDEVGLKTSFPIEPRLKSGMTTYCFGIKGGA